MIRRERNADPIRERLPEVFELRLASDGDQRLRWMAGIYFLDIDRQVRVSPNRR